MIQSGGALGHARALIRRRRRARLITWVTAMMTVPLIVLLAVIKGGGIGWIAAGLVALACITAVAALWLAHRRTERELIEATTKIVREGRQDTQDSQDTPDLR